MWAVDWASDLAAMLVVDWVLMLAGMSDYGLVAGWAVRLDVLKAESLVDEMVEKSAALLDVEMVDK